METQLERYEASAVVGQVADITNHENEQRLVSEHNRLEEETYSYLLKWTLVCQSNLLLHFMRLGIVVVYCHEELNGDAPARWIGAMVTGHYIVVGLSNLQMSLSLDRRSLDSVVSLHFPVLALFTMLEAIAYNFTLFAPAYVCAGFGIIWPTLPAGANTRMASLKNATKLNVISGVLAQIGLMVGLGTGGVTASLIGFRWVFILSAVWAFVCCVFVFFDLHGEGERLKEEQRGIVALMYAEFPDAVAPENKFRLVEPTYTAPENDKDESETEPSFLRSAEGRPFWLLAIYSGLQTARALEACAWWPLYCDDKWDASIGLSNLQVIVSAAMGIMSSVSMHTFLPMAALSEEKQLRRTLVLCGIPAALCILLWVFVFPNLNSFAMGWIAFAVYGTIEGFALISIAARCVKETPPELAGYISAIRVLMQTLIPGMQHVIIGFLWNVRSDHRYYFYWIAVLHALSGAIIIAYFLLRGAINKTQDAAEYETIPYTDDSST